MEEDTGVTGMLTKLRGRINVGIVAHICNPDSQGSKEKKKLEFEASPS